MAGARGESLSPATARQLRRLRIRLAALLAALVLVVVTVLSVVVVRLDARVRDEQNSATLLRRLDEVTRQLAFVDGELEPADPTTLLTEPAAVVVRPDTDAVELLEEQGVLDLIGQPTEDEIDELVAAVFFDLEEEIQDEILDNAGVDGDTRGQAIQNLLADPPADLVDEAVRVHIVSTAEDRGYDVEPLLVVFAPVDLALSDQELLDLAGRVIDGNDPDSFEIDVGEDVLGVQGTVLRDGLEVRGAAVAFVDLTSSQADHRQLRNQVIVVASALVAGSTLAAWILAGRSIRPAAAALGQQERFLAAAAHELRTPVAAIRATAEAPVGPDEDASQHLARVARLAAGASQLTDDLLTLARMDADRLELHTTPTRLDLLVEAVADDAPAYRLTLTPVVVDADVTLLTRAIGNLLTNAVVHGEAESAQPASVVVDAAGVTVTDHGPGIAPDELDEVFERFRTGARSPGHGLGLPLARWIARAHGGDLVALPADSGARLELRLPTRPAPPEHDHADDRPAARVVSASRRRRVGGGHEGGVADHPGSADRRDGRE